MTIVWQVKFWRSGFLAARAVCRISQGLKTGTGFLLGNEIVATNDHFVKSKDEAKSSLFEFLFDDNNIRTPRNTKVFVADSDPFFGGVGFGHLLSWSSGGGADINSLGWSLLLRELMGE